MRGIRLIKAGKLEEARRVLKAEEAKLLSAGCQYVIRACTEIPIALDADHASPVSLDPNRELANACVALQRDAVDHHRPEGCSIRRGCEVIDLPRSTFYYRSAATPPSLSDEQLRNLIGDIQDEFPGYGYRRVTRELSRRGHQVNHKRVSRVMKATDQGVRPRRRFVRTTDSDHDLPVFPNLYRNVIPTTPDTRCG